MEKNHTSSHSYRRWVGYDKLDNLWVGIIAGFIAMGAIYYSQTHYYNMSAMGEYADGFKIPFLKRSLLGALFVFLMFNYFDKTYAMKGVLFSVILVGLYIVFNMIF